MIMSLPWLIIPLIIYNIVAQFGSGVAETVKDAAGTVHHFTIFDTELFSLTMLSGNTWTFTLGNLILLITLVILFIEILKSTRTSKSAMLDHGLSIIVFIICLIEFLLYGKAQTTLFFFITFISLIDVVAGFTVGIRSARRDMNFGPGVGS